MLRYVVRRLIFSIPVLLASTVVVFVVVRSTTSPLAALRSNPRATPQDLENYKKALGLDKSGPAQYLTWLKNFLRGDWGRSLISNRPVGPDIRSALWNSAVLGLTGAAFYLIAGIIIGVISATRQYGFFDHIATGVGFLGLSMPPFWFGLIAQLVLGLYLTRWLGLQEPIFHTSGMFTPGSEGFDLLDRVRHLALPALTLSVQGVAIYSRYMRSSMLEVLASDYLRTARAKGLSERRVVIRHAVRNALIPVATLAAIDIGALAGGLIVTESIFQWRGMGSLFLEAQSRGDYAVILPWMVTVVALVILFNLIADVAYSLLDPRIRHE